MLTQDERDRLARWMGWELRPIGEGATAQAWHDGKDYVMLPEHWRPDTDGNDMLMLMERAEELDLGISVRYSFVTKKWSTELDDATLYGRAVADTAPLAVARAILAMLEAA